MVRIRHVNYMGRTSRVLVSHRVKGSRLWCFMTGSATRLANVPSNMVYVEDGLREQAASLNLHDFFCHSIRYVILRMHLSISYHHRSFCQANIYCDVLSSESTKDLTMYSEGCAGSLGRTGPCAYNNASTRLQCSRNVRSPSPLRECKTWI